MLSKLLVAYATIVTLIHESFQSSVDCSSSRANAIIVSETGKVHTLHGRSDGINSTVVFDYGHSVDGLPGLDVLDAEGDTSCFEMTYAESAAALEFYQSDGPLADAAAMDTYRVNQYNITGPGRVQNRLIQGAFRYQKLNLTCDGTLYFKNVGVVPTTDNTPISDLPGSFRSSSEELNRIWSVGARTVQMIEIPANSIPDFFQVHDNGTIAQSQAPQILASVEAQQLTSYNLSFLVQPLVRGFGFLVLGSSLNVGIYISVDMVNREVSVHAGSTALDTVLDKVALPANMTCLLGCWHHVEANVALTDIAVTMNGTSVLNITQTSSFYGSAGFGASFGQRALFRDFSVTGPQYTYSSSLTNRSYLADFFAGNNPHSTGVDGSRRDRIAYPGDQDVAGASALASTHNLEAVIGSLDLLGSYQTELGFFIPLAKIQQEPRTSRLDVEVTGLIGYSFNLLSAFASTYMHTGDVTFAQKWAPSVQLMLDWAHSQTLDNGLFNVSMASFGGDWDYYDPTQSGVVTKFNAVFAYALQECLPLLRDGGVNSTTYSVRLDNLRTAIDKHLWNSTLQAYYMSDALTDAFAQDANALAILAGVNRDPTHSTATILKTLDSLFVPAGPQSFSSAAFAAGFQPYISPYASAYHLRAAFAANETSTVQKLLHTLWAPMANMSNANYTGAYWETLDQDGRPAFGLSTSLAHGWSAGPTASLSSYVLGARPSTPGWRNFTVAPQTLGLESAHGSVPTMNGSVDVTWEFDRENLLTMVVEAPANTTGTVFLPRPMLIAANSTTFVVNGKVQTEPFVFEGGNTTFVLRQQRNSPCGE